MQSLNGRPILQMSQLRAIWAILMKNIPLHQPTVSAIRLKVVVFFTPYGNVNPMESGSLFGIKVFVISDIRKYSSLLF